MTVRYWNPLWELETTRHRRQLDELFNQIGPATSQQSKKQIHWTPAARLVDQGDAYVLTMLLPVVNPDAIDIQVSRNAIAISGERQPTSVAAEHTVLYDDISYGTFRRVINLPDAIQNTQVQADFNAGHLTLTMPKAEEVRHRVVKVNVANGAKPAISTAADNGASTAQETTAQ
ncbi:18 kDa heat shock protein [Halomicronema hongdechloris C2206]|uniref:18 kDa heat shock protein n=1 Tax=Halomicronema hongdechloris C2206 TaxID=1641165 RepID=A0A1Z3HT22_9CYAN|nr:Hsp20/alpha crystallin family protein [Halomicronema hongdechloris]ASC73444.1 18 kDa heat shock protein [Halomicronema hongdechloris C2206]